MYSKLHLIRHGTTEGNKKQWYYGELDLPILDEGKETLIKLREDGIYPYINGKFFTSGMRRTNETLKVLYGDIDFIEIQELREMKFGKIEGKTYEEVKDDEDFIAWIEDEKGNLCIPGGDSKNSFGERIMKGLEKTLHLHLVESLKFRHKKEDVESICVCHGGVIGGLMLKLFPDERDFFNWIPNQGRGYSLLIENGKIVGYKEI